MRGETNETVETRVATGCGIGSGKESRRRALRGSLVATAVLAAGCNFAPLSLEGAGVSVATSQAVADCQKVGSATATVMNKILFFPRSRQKVAEELENKARNEAAKIGGNTIAPSSPEVDGSRSFVVYDCPDA